MLDSAEVLFGSLFPALPSACVNVLVNRAGANVALGLLPERLQSRRVARPLDRVLQVANGKVLEGVQPVLRADACGSIREVAVPQF
jgi:hypothetical protein